VDILPSMSMSMSLLFPSMVNVHSLLFNVYRNTHLNGLLHDDLLEYGHLNRNMNWLRDMDHFVDGNGNVLRYLHRDGYVLVNRNGHMFVNRYRNVLKDRNTDRHGDTYVHRVRFGYMYNLRHVNNLGDFLDNGNLVRNGHGMRNMDGMWNWYKFVNGVRFRNGHWLRDGHDLVNVLDNLVDMSMMPAVVPGIGRGGKEGRRRKSNRKDLHD